LLPAFEIEGDSIMLRYIAIALAAAVVTCAAPTSVSAHGGHGGGSFAGGHAGSFSGGHSFAFSGSHAAFGNHVAGRGFVFHHGFHRRFFFVGGPGIYADDDGCYVRVWTHWGWRWRNVCY
jgi:hypothetical protein